MGKYSKIEWTTHTFNCWLGCTKVSPGCKNCYAERLMDHRMGRVKWGPGQPRSRTSAGNWRKPIAWDRAAEAAGRRDRVFCASLADFLDPEVPTLWLADLLVLIDSTPSLDWLLLTKRPEQWRSRMEEVAEPYVEGLAAEAHPGAEIAYDWCCGIPPKNVWMGTTVEDQQRADERVPELIQIPAVIRFLSVEPLLGHVDLVLDGIDWVICGGESGPGARPMHPEWARSVRDQCKAAGVSFLFKQWGAWSPGRREEVPTGLTDSSRGKLMKWMVASSTDRSPPFREGATVYHANSLYDSYEPLHRVGKKQAGRLLDGVTHDAVPVLG